MSDDNVTELPPSRDRKSRIKERLREIVESKGPLEDPAAERVRTLVKSLATRPLEVDEATRALLLDASIAAQKIRNLTWAVDQLMMVTEHNTNRGASAQLASACWTINNIVGEIARDLENLFDRRI